MSQKALFLDRDGIINIDHGYVYQKENFEFMPDIFALCKQAQTLNYRIFVITNQAGIARGFYSEEDFHQLTFWMVEQFAQNGIVIDKVYHCPHHPTKGESVYTQTCDCRKPAPGMILQAKKEFDVDLSRSVFIGDKVSDMQAADNAGIPKRLFLAGQYGDEESIEATRICALKDAISHL